MIVIELLGNDDMVRMMRLTMGALRLKNIMIPIVRLMVLLLVLSVADDGFWLPGFHQHQPASVQSAA